MGGVYADGSVVLVFVAAVSERPGGVWLGVEVHRFCVDPEGLGLAGNVALRWDRMAERYCSPLAPRCSCILVRAKEVWRGRRVERRRADGTEAMLV